MTLGSDLMAKLQAGRMAIEQIQSDARYAPEYKEELSKRVRDMGVKDAQQTAQRAMEAAQRRTDNAVKRLDEQVKAHDATTDWAKLGALQTEVNATFHAARSWSEIDAYISAHATDETAMRAVASVGVNALREHALTQDVQSASVVADLTKRLDESIAALEPEPLQAARVELTEAQRAERDTYGEIASVNALWNVDGTFAPGATGNIFGAVGTPINAPKIDLRPNGRGGFLAIVENGIFG